MFNGIKNSANGMKSTAKNASNNIKRMIKELSKANWKGMPPLFWAYAVLGIIAFIIIIFVIIPMFNIF